MSTDIATLGIKVDSSDVRNASGELRILVEVGTKAEKATDELKNSFGGLKSVIAGLGLGALIKEGIGLADTYSNVEGRLSLVTSGTAELNSVTEKLFQSAQRSRASFEATSDLYGSLARSTKALGTSQGDLLQVTETINKALIVSGASAATAEAALVQLGQGFASGTLRGDELNSVLEGTPRLAQAIADGMGVTVGQLRALGGEGKITGETVFNALKSQREAVEKEFSKMPTTVAQSFTVLENEILKYVGQANEASGVTSVLSQGIAGFTHNLDIIVPVVATLATGLGVGFVTSAVAARIAALETAGGIASIGVAAKASGSALLGAFGGPVGLLVTGLTVGIAGLAAESSRAGGVISTVNKSYDEMNKRLSDAKMEADNAKTGTKNLSTAIDQAGPSYTALTGKVKILAGWLYTQADAAKKARIEMAATSLAEAKKNESAALALTPAGRGETRRNNRNALANGDFLALDFSAVTGAARSALSGGRTDREAEAAYQRSVQVSIQARKDLEAAYQSSNSAAKGASAVNEAEIKKLKGQIDDLKKVREAANPKERGRIDKQIANRERKVELLGTGAAEDAVSAAVGNATSGGSGKSKAETDYENAVKASKRYAEQLGEETQAIGMNAVQMKLADAQREAAKAPTAALRQSILAEANAWAAATIANEASTEARKASIDWIDRQRDAQAQATKTGKELADQLEFEARLQGMTASQRVTAITLRDLEAKGIKEGTVAWDLYGRKILDAAGAKGALEEEANAAARLSDHMRTMNDNLHQASNSFGDLFGNAGQGFAQLIQGVSDYAEASVEAEARIAEARAKNDPAALASAQADAAEEMAQREAQAYAMVIGGVKSMFSQKSAAYKTLEAIERVYAAVRLANAVKEVFFEGVKTTAAVGGAATRMATDTAETASSVSKSGIRAAADGVAAFAKTLASLPFPLNLAAGAAVLAALVSVGVKVAGGGGGGKSASASAETSTKPAETYNGAVDEYGNPTSAYSVLKAGRVSVGSNDNAPSTGYAPAANQTVAGGDFNFIVQGNVAEDVMPRIQEQLREFQAQTVDKARSAAAKDRALSDSRQRIGGR